FAAGLLGRPRATISDLAGSLRAQANGPFEGKVHADRIIAFFRAGLGLDTSTRTRARTLVFLPDVRGCGVRWANRLNCSPGHVTGMQAGDSVDLAGNAVRFDGMTVRLQDLDFGDFGSLSATSGRLTVGGAVAVGGQGGAVSIARAGQVWIDGYRDSDPLRVD